MKLSPRRREDPELNLTSLIDVVLLLVIFFMVSTTFIEEGRLRVELPTSSNEPVTSVQDPIVITITAQGGYRVNDRMLVNNSRAQTLRGALAKVFTTGTGTSQHWDANANGMMIGLADDNGQFSHTVQVEAAASPTNTNSAASATAILNLDSSSGGTRTDMCDATVTLNSADFTLNFTATDATARKGWWVAFGGAASVTNQSLMQISG